VTYLQPADLDALQAARDPEELARRPFSPTVAAVVGSINPCV
jgi:hypothetical protein